MRKLIYTFTVAAIYISITCPVLARAVQAQVSMPDVGGPMPSVDGKTTITPGGVQETPSPTVPPAPVPIEPVEPAITPEPNQPEVVAPPTVLEPVPPPDTRTVPRIEMGSPASPSVPAGTGAGPETISTSEALPAQDTFGFPEEDTFASDESAEIIPRAGLGYGWISLLGTAMAAAGIVMKKVVRKKELV